MYASWPSLPAAHATLTTERPATALPGPDFHRLDHASFAWRLPTFRAKGYVPLAGAEAQLPQGDSETRGMRIFLRYIDVRDARPWVSLRLRGRCWRAAQSPLILIERASYLKNERPTSYAASLTVTAGARRPCGYGVFAQ